MYSSVQVAPPTYGTMSTYEALVATPAPPDPKSWAPGQLLV